METPQSLPDPALLRIEALVRETQQNFFDNLEQILQRRLDPLLEGTQSMLHAGSESNLRAQAEPLLLRVRDLLVESMQELIRGQMDTLMEQVRPLLLGLSAELIQQHAGPLFGQARAAMEDALQGLVQRQLQPMLDNARSGFQDGVPLATTFTDSVMARIREAVTDPVEDLLQRKAPVYAQRLGRRMLDYLLAGTLFTLAAIFLLLGGVLGLQELGLRPYLTYIIGGLVALAGGLVFLRIWRSGASVSQKN